MAYAGDAASVRTGMTADDVAEGYLRLPRNTMSARSRALSSRGVEAILSAFDKHKQLALKQLCTERVELESRKRALLDRLAASSSGAALPAPDLLVTLNLKMKDNSAALARIAGGDGSIVSSLLDALHDPSLAGGVTLAVASEEDAGEGADAAVWRRRLNTRRGTGHPGSHVTHNAPTNTGGRDLFNTLAVASPDDSMSYYQRQQKKYGAARRGSTSIAGSWEEVLGADATPGNSDAGMPVPAESHVMSSAPAAGQDAAAAAAGMGRMNRSPPPAPKRVDSTPPHSGGKYSDGAIHSLLSQARAILSGDVIPSPPASAAAPAAPAPAASQREAQYPAASPVVYSFASPSPAPASARDEMMDAYGAMDSVSQGGPARMPSPYRARRGSGASAMTSKTAATSFKLATETLMPLPRSTRSATTAKVASRGMDALLHRFPKTMQHAIREMACDLAELQVRKESMLARLSADAQRAEDDPLPTVYTTLCDHIAERLKRLQRMAGTDAMHMVYAAVNTPANREAMGLELEAEEEIQGAGTATAMDDETAARVWRRKLDASKVQPVRGVRGEAAAAVHDDATNVGGRQLWNELNRRNPTETMSYYQKQQLKYGRARRGSTSIAGAWEAVFDPETTTRMDAAANRGPESLVVLERAPSPRPTHIVGAPRSVSPARGGFSGGGQVASPRSLAHGTSMYTAPLHRAASPPRAGTSGMLASPPVSSASSSVAASVSPLLSTAHAAVAAAQTAGDVDSLLRVAAAMQSRLQAMR